MGEKFSNICIVTRNTQEFTEAFITELIYNRKFDTYFICMHLLFCENDTGAFSTS